MLTTSSREDVSASVFFLQRHDDYNTCKPYQLEYHSPSILRSNLRSQKEDVLIKDLRGIESTFTFATNGFAVLELESEMSYEDYDNDDKVSGIYCREVAACLLSYMQAKSVQVYDYKVSSPCGIPTIL
jgi:hypothetical protein